MVTETILEPDKDRIRKRLTKYTRMAFHMLPHLDKPRILDIGCGSGIPTMDLARLSNGEIIGLDINQPSLNRLTGKIKRRGLSERVIILERSMSDMDFPDESFDIIWSEGSLFIIGFTKGLEEWRRFLKPKGFLVVHDETGNIMEKLEQISACGYDLLDHFTLDKDIWWHEYFAPLQKLISRIKARYGDNPKALAEIEREQSEIDMFKNNPDRYTSVFLIMQKK